MMDKRKILEEFNAYVVGHGLPPYAFLTADTYRRNPEYRVAVQARRDAYTAKIVSLNQNAILSRL